MDMTRPGLAKSLEQSLLDSASIFNGEFGHLLDVAVEDYSRRRPRVLAAKITLEAGRIIYQAPADIRSLGVSYWGTAQRNGMQPWEQGFPARLPRARLIHSESGRQLLFDFPPTDGHICTCGAEYQYTYNAVHVLGDDGSETTIPTHDRSLLLLRASAEAMREMAMRNVKKPVSTQDVVGGQTRSGTPGALFEIFFKAYNEQVCRD